jgi:hypothetical protein
VPLTVHTVAVVEANETGKLDVDVALNVNGVPTVCVAGLAKVIVCAVGAATAAFTVKLCGTGVAAA